MNVAWEQIKHEVHGWQNPASEAWARAVFERAMRAARAEGCARAREQAAGVARAEAAECERLKQRAAESGFLGARQCWQAGQTAVEGVERNIRAMQDEGAGEGR